MRAVSVIAFVAACISFSTRAGQPLGLSGADLRGALAALEEPASGDHPKIARQFGMSGMGGGPIALPATFLFFGPSGCLTAAVVPKQFEAVDDHCLGIRDAPTLASFSERMSQREEEVRAHAKASDEQPVVLVLTPPLSIVRNMMGTEKYEELSEGVDRALADFRARFPDHAYVVVEPFPTPQGER